MKKIITNWIPLLTFGLIIFFLSSRPINSPVNFSYSDKIAHAVFYSVLSFLFARAVVLKKRTKKYMNSLLLITIVTAYGAFIEIYQAYVPTRTPSLLDGIANAVGACLGILIYLFYNKFAWGKTQTEVSK